MQLQDAYAVFFQRELWLVGLNISAYSHSGTAFAHDNDRRRKLLAHRHQLENWSSRSTERVLRSFRCPLLQGRTSQDLDGPRPRQEAARSPPGHRKRDADLDARKAMSRANRADRLAKYS